MRTILLLGLMCSWSIANILNLESFQANFIQTITEPNNQQIKYTGTLYIQNGNNALWEYKTPVEKSIYIKKDNVVVVEPELEQILFRKFSAQPNFLTLLSNATKIDTNLYQTTFNEISYKIQIKNKIIDTITYQDQLENNISIMFNTQSINIVIPDKIFEFQIPEGYDIL